jgi:dolichol-phosphate mannosyltransferase
MDADLQHPPELLPAIFQKLKQGIDIVIPTRFMKGGSDGGLNLFRKLVSWTARMIGRTFIKKLRCITDCTGGFFGINRKVVNGILLNPIGWKILIEILTKGSYTTVYEIPYSFADRYTGASKMSLRQQWFYLLHIFRLVSTSPEDRRFYIFCFVGLIGMIINLLIFSLLFEIIGFSALIASVCASFIAMINNFLWNNNLTWRGQKHAKLYKKILQFLQFVIISTTGIGIVALVVFIFINLHLNEIIGQFVGIIIAMLWNYTANNLWTWKHIKNFKYKENHEQNTN